MEHFALMWANSLGSVVKLQGSGLTLLITLPTLHFEPTLHSVEVTKVQQEHGGDSPDTVAHIEQALLE